MPAHRLWMKSGASGRAINFYHYALLNTLYYVEFAIIINFLFS